MDTRVGLGIPRPPFVQAMRAAKLERFLAPEAMGEDLPEPSADIYALGVLIAELLTGPLPRVSDISLVDRNSDLPEQIEAFYRKATHENPNARFKSARELFDELSQITHRVPPVLRARTTSRPSLPPPPIIRPAETTDPGLAPRLDSTRPTPEPVPVLAARVEDLPAEPSLPQEGATALKPEDAPSPESTATPTSPPHLKVIAGGGPSLGDGPDELTEAELPAEPPNQEVAAQQSEAPLESSVPEEGADEYSQLPFSPEQDVPLVAGPLFGAVLRSEPESSPWTRLVALVKRGLGRNDNVPQPGKLNGAFGFGAEPHPQPVEAPPLPPPPAQMNAGELVQTPPALPPPPGHLSASNELPPEAFADDKPPPPVLDEAARPWHPEPEDGGEQTLVVGGESQWGDQAHGFAMMDGPGLFDDPPKRPLLPSWTSIRANRPLFHAVLGAIAVMGVALGAAVAYWIAKAPDATELPVVDTTAPAEAAPKAGSGADRPAAQPLDHATVSAAASKDTKSAKVTGAPSPCPAGMIHVPAGAFQLGSGGDDKMRFNDEHKLATTHLPAFCVDEFEYPNRRGAEPMVNVAWADARKLCEAKGRRLCSEPEWEKACKGPGNWRFPYGNAYDALACNTESEGGEDGRVVGAGTFPKCRSWYGVADLGGSLLEWTSSSYGGTTNRAQKGGSFKRPDRMSRCAARKGGAPIDKSDEVGFRCCLQL
jgi:formylglycine-generating enzyme required for sulfatase activity